MPAMLAWNVLLVEDNPADANLICLCAGDHARVELFHAPNAFQATQYLARHHPFEDVPVPDLVLLDLMLPGFNGFDVLHALRERAILVQIPVIVLTSSIYASDRDRALALGATEYVIKPVEWGRWQLEISRVFRQHLKGFVD
ncbi:MAG: response regulator [Planctomycetes bacterium]|nr:response regulator [Planctomycetota bacterium]